MCKKYLRGSEIFYSKSRPGDSPMWTDMQKIKSLYLSGRRMKVGDGRLTSFWHDAWCDKVPLKDSFPETFISVMSKISQLLLQQTLGGIFPSEDICLPILLFKSMVCWGL
jgi:hypothetical protein